jgi:phosphoribosylaminoimidazolecarboxamide formyltransferase / IMP cyclohydrolase
MQSRQLRYGENPHQTASFSVNEISGLRIHQGKDPSYTNILDVDAALRILLEFEEPACAVIKHNSPCGVALGDNAADAYVRARDVDGKSAFGSIVGINRPLDVQTAEAITSTFIEGVVAPSVDSDALRILSEKKNLRVATVNFEGLRKIQALGSEVRTTLIGELIQQFDSVSEARQAWPYTRCQGDGNEESRSYPCVVTSRQPTDAEWTALRFAWRACAYVRSNAIVFSTDAKTLGIGAGQGNRDDSAKIARGCLGVDFKTQTIVGPTRFQDDVVVAASDAFFPFADGLHQIVAAGATAVVHPGGSIRDEEVIAVANEHNIAMVFTGRRHFRH